MSNGRNICCGWQVDSWRFISCKGREKEIPLIRIVMAGFIENPV
jgi:hypothetical protein